MMEIDKFIDSFFSGTAEDLAALKIHQLDNLFLLLVKARGRIRQRGVAVRQDGKYLLRSRIYVLVVILKISSG